MTEYPFRIGMRAMALLFLACAAYPPDAHARELAPGLHKVQLSNGLNAVVKESHRAPAVAVQVWVQAGSVYEVDAEAGITHLIEHMIFKGTERRGPGAIAREIESLGGTINAFTSPDYTVYHCVVPAQFLDTALDVLADAIFHSTFDSDELEREKKVVLEEIRMRDDQPRSRLSRLMMETVYTGHPYRRPVIGFPETVKSITRKEILAYMARRYQPDLMSLVVVGDVDAHKALAAVQEVFGSTSGQPSGEFVHPAEPPQRAPRIARQSMDVQEGYLGVAFSGLPNFNHPDVPVLDVLATLLGSGESARLTLALRNRLQLVSTVSASAYTPAGPGLFEIKASLDPDKTGAALTQILQEVFRLADQQVPVEELDRARIKVEAGFVYDQETMEGEAQKLGVFETVARDPLAEGRYLERLRELTPQDIHRVARQIFRLDAVNVAMIMPEGRMPRLDLEEIGIMGQEAELQAMGVESTTLATVAHPVRRVNLPNGLTILIQEAPDVPTAALRLVFPGGVRYETRETNGLFNFLAHAWTKGTDAHNAEKIAELTEGMGGSISGFSGQNTFGLEARFLSRSLEQGLALFAEIVLTPTFPQEEVDRLKPLLLAKLKLQDDSLPGVAVREFRRLIFSPHPYGMDPLGRKPVIEDMTSQELLLTFRGYAVPDRAVLAVVGDVRTEKMVSILETLFGGWSASATIPLAAPPAPDPMDAPRLVNLERDKQQVHMVLGFGGTTFINPDRFALEVLNGVLTSQGGRLFMELRDKESLAYAVQSFVGLGLDHGAFGLYIACAPEKKDRALKGLWKEIYRVAETPVPPDELERAKRWVVGNHEIGLQTNGARALDMALNELYGLGFNFTSRYVQEINKVSADHVLAAARRYLDPAKYVLVRVGP